MRRLWVPMAVQCHRAFKAHVAAANEEHARHAQRAQALNFAKAQGESVGRRFDAPRNGREGKDIGSEISDAVPAVGNHGLGVERPAADELGNGHGQVTEQANPRYAHAGVVLVGRGEVGAVMVMVVMAKEAVAMAVAMIVIVVVAVIACLASGAHDEGQRADAAAEDGADEEHGAARRQGVGERNVAIGRRRQREGRHDGGRRRQRLESSAGARLVLRCPLLEAKWHGQGAPLASSSRRPRAAPHGQARGAPGLSRHADAAPFVSPVSDERADEIQGRAARRHGMGTGRECFSQALPFLPLPAAGPEEKLSERGPGPSSGDRVRRVRPLRTHDWISVGSAASGLFWRA